MALSATQSKQIKTLLASLGAKVLEVYLHGGYLSKQEMLHEIDVRGLDTTYQLLATSSLEDLLSKE